MKLILYNGLISTAFALTLSLQGCMGPSNNDLAPEIVATLVDGTPFKLSDQKGQFVLLHFWGSWCAPCLRENPYLVQMHQELGDKVNFVSIALEKDDLQWQKATEKAGISWRNQIVSKSRMVMSNEFALAYGVTEIPATFLIGPDGKLISQFHLEQIPEVLNAMQNEE